MFELLVVKYLMYLSNVPLATSPGGLDQADTTKAMHELGFDGFFRGAHSHSCIIHKRPQTEVGWTTYLTGETITQNFFTL